jgi:hypothetical protein
MKFKLIFKRYSCGDYMYIDQPKDSADIPEGAWSETITTQQTEKVSKVSRQEKKTIDGEDYFRQYQIDQPEPGTYFKMSGYNHRREGDNWVKDVDELRWFIEVPDLEAMVKLIAGYGGELEINVDQPPEWIVEVS